MTKTVVSRVPRGVAGGLKDGVLTKHVKRSKHLLRKLDAWCFDAALFQGWLDEGMTHIRVLDSDDSMCYTVDVRTFTIHCVDLEYGDDRVQLGLPRVYWATEPWEGD